MARRLIATCCLMLLCSGCRYAFGPHATLPPGWRVGRGPAFLASGETAIPYPAEEGLIDTTATAERRDLVDGEPFEGAAPPSGEISEDCIGEGAVCEIPCETTPPLGWRLRACLAGLHGDVHHVLFNRPEYYVHPRFHPVPTRPVFLPADCEVPPATVAPAVAPVPIPADSAPTLKPPADSPTGEAPPIVPMPPALPREMGNPQPPSGDAADADRLTTAPARLPATGNPASWLFQPQPEPTPAPVSQARTYATADGWKVTR